MKKNRLLRIRFLVAVVTILTLGMAFSTVSAGVSGEGGGPSNLGDPDSIEGAYVGQETIPGNDEGTGGESASGNGERTGKEESSSGNNGGEEAPPESSTDGEEEEATILVSEAPEELPRTGGSYQPYLAGGFFLVLAGLALIFNKYFEFV